MTEEQADHDLEQERWRTGSILCHLSINVSCGGCVVSIVLFVCKKNLMQEEEESSCYINLIINLSVLFFPFVLWFPSSS